ncbi:alpha/beta hydrolase-fold protein [Owenweeksia hongkongensis]|uniref:alpha/beta hydrolase-fold protein n=1 Tax=Owenweeksia hongkongensis TaxID=253245 RepID=UPI003A95D198
MKYLFSFAFFISAIASYACSCANPGKMNNKQYEHYDFIATGVIDGIEEDDEVKMVFFNVSHSYKSRAELNDIVFTTPLSSAACGISPNVGEEWLIYATRHADGLHVSLCSRSIVLKAEGMSGVPDRAQEDLLFLENKEQENEKYAIGNIETIQSEALGESRTLNIYLPEGYSVDSTYPVIYLLDGSAHEDFLHVAGLLQFCNYPWLKFMPKCILVGIENVDRKRDFTYPSSDEDYKKKYPTTGSSAAFMQFIETELQPYIETNYPVNGTDMLIGQSLGGLFATEVLYKKPELFNHYFIVSPSLWYDNLSLLEQEPAFAADNFDKEITVYVAVGNEGRVMKAVAKKLYKEVKSANKVKSQFEYFKDEDHASILHEALYRGFKGFNARVAE